MSVDVIVPVGGGPREVLARLRALRAAVGDTPHGAIVVDAGLDPERRAAVEALLRAWPGARLVAAALPGSAQAALRAGLGASRADLALLLDERSFLPRGGLARLVALAERDPGVALAQALVTGEGATALVLPPGTTWPALDAAASDAAGERSVDLPGAPLPTGLLLRRAALLTAAQDGGQDPTADLLAALPDLPARLRTAGFQARLVLGVVVHRERAGDGDLRRSGTGQRKAVSAAEPPAAPVPLALEAVRRAVAVRTRVHLGPLLRFAVRHPKKAARLALGHARAGLGGRPGVTPDVFDPRREDLERLRRPGRLTVNVLLPGVAVNGGTIHVIDLATRLVQDDVDVRLLAPMPVDRRLLAGAPFEPAVYTSAEALVRGAPAADATIATYWRTAPWLAELTRDGRAGAGLYYLQDDEALFYPEGDPRRRQVTATYGLGARLVATSTWLRDQVARLGHDAEVLPIGFLPDRFRPRPPRGPRPGGGLRLIALANPDSPRRGAETLFEALAQVHRARPDITFVLFGAADLGTRRLPFPVEDEGRIAERDRLPALYSGCDLFVDPSDHQAFGLPAMEAMASGLACVLPGQGGVTTYARDGENALLVPPRDPARLAEAVLRLADDPALRGRLAQAARRTALASTLDDEAARWRALLERAIGSARRPRASA